MGRPSRSSDQFIMRLPEGMRDRIKSASEMNNRSMNSEIVERLQYTFEGLDADLSELHGKINDLESKNRVLELDMDARRQEVLAHKGRVRELERALAATEREVERKDAELTDLTETVARHEATMLRVSDWRKAAEKLTFAIDATGAERPWGDTLDVVGSLLDNSALRLARIDCVLFDFEDFLVEGDPSERDAMLLEKVLEIRKVKRGD